MKAVAVSTGVYVLLNRDSQGMGSEDFFARDVIKTRHEYPRLERWYLRELNSRVKIYGLKPEAVLSAVRPMTPVLF
jgi:hypothetical protein